MQGKELCYNNLNDTDAAFECVAEFDGAGRRDHQARQPVRRGDGRVARRGVGASALRCDPVSAFGGIVALNRTLDAAAAERIAAIFTEVIIAPDADDDGARRPRAQEEPAPAAHRRRARPGRAGITVRSVAGGFLAQSRDAGRIGADELRTVTMRAPTDAELRRPALRVPRLPST